MRGNMVADCLGQVCLQVLGHAEGLDLLSSEHGRHRLVWGEILLVLRILQIVLLEVSPEPLDDLGPCQLLVLLGADDGGQFGGKVQGLSQTVQLLLGHCCNVSLISG
eukprot:TRINITY_DN10395_c0_g2_i2.p1 TRINITY_DN10395_c0_g2~~TRINITY_DN10395_c0_g2_i2.p1  ORF type:complete len:107 (+),score=3.18 TRINITY_DN10395_c0_g2_i2:440-760(+)